MHCGRRALPDTHQVVGSIPYTRKKKKQTKNVLPALMVQFFQMNIY